MGRVRVNREEYDARGGRGRKNLDWRNRALSVSVSVLGLNFCFRAGGGGCVIPRGSPHSHLRLGVAAALDLASFKEKKKKPKQNPQVNYEYTL